MEFGFGSFTFVSQGIQHLMAMENKVTVDYQRLSMCYYVKDHIRISNQASFYWDLLLSC